MGRKGTIVATADGGTTWTPQSSGTDAALSSVPFATATQGWAVGIKGTILATADGGNTWSRQSSGTKADLESVHFASASQGWAVGGVTFLRSSPQDSAPFVASFLPEKKHSKLTWTAASAEGDSEATVRKAPVVGSDPQDSSHRQ